MTLQTVVQNALERISLSRPELVIGSNDEGVRTMLALVNQEGLALVDRHTWQAITKEVSFASIVGEIQTGFIPDDFDRFIAGTFYNRTQRQLVAGPMTNAQWQQYKSDGFAGPDQMFRVRGGEIMILPAAPADETIVFEYVSKNWVRDDKKAMDTDTDESLIDDEILTLGAVWRYLRVKGLDYAEEFRTYEIQLANAIARDGGSSNLDFMSGSGKPARPLRNVVTS